MANTTPYYTIAQADVKFAAGGKSVSEAFNQVLQFNRNKYSATAISQSGAIAFSLASSNNIDGVVIRHKIMSDGRNPITFGSEFNVFGKPENDIYPSGLQIFYFNYVGGDVDVAIPTYAGTSSGGGSTNTAPTTNADSYSVDENQTLTVNAANGVLANDNDNEGDSLTASVVSGVSNGTLNLNPDGSFTYTPNTDYTGSDSFTYKTNDGTVDGNTATVSITVNEVTAAFDPANISPDMIWLKGNVATTDANTSGDAITSAQNSLSGADFIGNAFVNTKNGKECLDFTSTSSVLRGAIPASFFRGTSSLFAEIWLRDGRPSSSNVIAFTTNPAETSTVLIYIDSSGKLSILLEANGVSVTAKSTTAQFSDGDTGDFAGVEIAINTTADEIEMYKNGTQITVDNPDISSIDLSLFADNGNTIIGCREISGSRDLQFDGWMLNIIWQPVIYTAQQRTNLLSL